LRIKFILLLVFFCLSSANLIAKKSIIADPQNTIHDSTVIFSKTDDPYYELANEISLAENIPICNTIEEIKECNPIYVLWVVSPSFLSDKIVHNFLKQLQNNRLGFSIGVISGNTIGDARQLYNRKSENENRIVSKINGRFGFNREDNYKIFNYSDSDTSYLEFSKENILQTLSNSDYLNFAGGGGSNFWVEKRIPKIQSNEIPNLQSSTIISGACQTFRIWNNNSIALSFIEKGAAAYAGFVYSSIPYFLFSFPNGFPYKYTWTDFPIGHIIQIQNQGIVEGFAAYPWFILLGDPRKYVNENKPYEVLRDSLNNKKRVLEIQSPFSNYIPIHIPDGKKYKFVKVPGIGSKWDKDKFYNSRIQMVDIQNDKYILFKHNGGQVTIQLNQDAPWYRSFFHIITSSLDYTYLFLSDTNGQVLFLIIAVVFVILAARKALRKKPSNYIYLIAIFMGIAVMILKFGYVLYRIDRTMIISKELNVGLLSIFLSSIFIAVGYIFFQLSRTKFGQLLSIMISTFQVWAPTIFWFLFIFLVNSASVRRFDFSIYNYSPVLLPLFTFVFELILLITIFNIIFYKVTRSNISFK